MRCGPAVARSGSDLRNGNVLCSLPTQTGGRGAGSVYRRSTHLTDLSAGTKRQILSTSPFRGVAILMPARGAGARLVRTASQQPSKKQSSKKQSSKLDLPRYRGELGACVQSI